jgi:hypothetical protein
MDLQYVVPDPERRAGPQPRRRPSRSNSSAVFHPPMDRTRGHGHAGGLQSHLPPATPVNTKLTGASEVKD